MVIDDKHISKERVFFFFFLIIWIYDILLAKGKKRFTPFLFCFSYSEWPRSWKETLFVCLLGSLTNLITKISSTFYFSPMFCFCVKLKAARMT